MGANWTGLTGIQYSQLFERIPTTIDDHFKILTYGSDNLYPQEMEQIRLASPLTKSSTEVLSDFINGIGWEANNDQVVNRFGETARDLLNLVSKDAARFSGAFAIHINFNGNGQGLELQRIPLEYIRMAVSKRADGRITHVYVSDNWENSSNKRELKPVRFPILNPLTAAEETITEGRGQIMYFTGRESGKYPLATWDSIIDTAITDRNIQAFEKNNVARGFHGTVFFKWPQPINSKEEENEIKAKVDAALGTESPGAQVVSVDEEFTANLIETVQGLNVDDIFIATLESVETRVMSVFRQPPALLGRTPGDGAVFTQLAYAESAEIYNLMTRPNRIILSRAFNKVTDLLGFEVGAIVENEIAKPIEPVANG